MKKHLKKLINNLVDLSFKDGVTIERQAVRAIKILKSLPKYQAIETLTEYIRQLKRLERQHTMYIESVIPLNKVQLKNIKRNIEKKVKVTKIITEVNPAILGGFILKVGDEVWDASVLAHLNQVKEAISHGRPD